MYKYWLLIVASLLGNSLCLNDYYWKDYTGKIPEDAVPGGYDVNKDTTYIGLVYLTDAGVFPATIHSGDKVVYASANKVRKSENYIQILCSEDQENIKWIPANKTDFHFLTMNKHLIRGGVQDKNWLNIGRINYQSEVIIGKILSGRSAIHDAQMNFIHNNEEKIAFSYEVLSFENTANPKRDAEVVTANEGDFVF